MKPSNKTPSTTIKIQHDVPAHALYDEKMVQGSLADFIADAIQWLYRKTKTSYFNAQTDTADTPVILCIDDEEMIQIGMAEYIRKSGCTPIRAMNTEQVFAAIAIQVPNMIFLDIHMPGDDTLELLKSLKKNSRTADVPVVLVTGVNDIGLISRYLEAGAHDYFLKSARLSSFESQLGLDRKHVAFENTSSASQPVSTAPKNPDADAIVLDSRDEDCLLLLREAVKKLEKNMHRADLPDDIKHDLNNVLFGIATAADMMDD